MRKKKDKIEKETIRKIDGKRMTRNRKTGPEREDRLHDQPERKKKS